MCPARPVEVTADGEAQAATVVEADGQVTSRAGVALGMFAADCLPVLMADAQAGVIGAAHCGRKGLQRGIIGATIDAMVAKALRRSASRPRSDRASAATVTRSATPSPTSSTRNSPVRSP